MREFIHRSEGDNQRWQQHFQNKENGFQMQDDEEEGFKMQEDKDEGIKMPESKPMIKMFYEEPKKMSMGKQPLQMVEKETAQSPIKTAEELKSKYLDKSKTDSNEDLQQTDWFRYIDKNNVMIITKTEVSEETLLKEGLRPLSQIIKSKVLRDDFVRAYNTSTRFKALLKEADFYNATIISSTVTSTASEFDDNNNYTGSKIRIIPSNDKVPKNNTPLNIGKMTWELTNMKNHTAIDELDTKARAKEIEKVDYVKSIIKIESEAVFNQKLILLEAGVTYPYKGLEKYDKMKIDELEKNKAQFMKDYFDENYEKVKVEGQKVTAKQKYEATYDRLVKEGPIKNGK